MPRDFWHQVFLFCRRCRWYRLCTLTCEYLREFSKKIRNDPAVIFRGLGKDDSWKKNLKQKIPWHGPFKLRASFMRQSKWPFLGRRPTRAWESWTVRRWCWGRDCSLRTRSSTIHFLKYIKRRLINKKRISLKSTFWCTVRWKPLIRIVSQFVQRKLYF